MKLTSIEKNGISCVLVESDDVVISDTQSALDLLMLAKYEKGTKNLILPKSLLAEGFFVLRTGLAGEVLQKFVNYGGRIAIYGDYSCYTSKPLKDFIYESNQGKDIFFASSVDEALDFLTQSGSKSMGNAMQTMISQEKPCDYTVVYQVVKAAFASAEHSDGTEQDLVTALRSSEAFIPQLSLVARQGEQIIGHILFTKVSVGEKTALALAPLAVLPNNQRQGVGQALIAEGHRIAKELGYDYAIVLGSPAYYSKAGYNPASRFGIKSPFDVPDEYFMAIRLNQNAEFLNGTPKYDPAFGIV